jgi:PAS domain S-box-containing protein
MGSEGLLGAIFVASTAPPEELLLEGLRSLSTDLALALSAAELGERMHLQRSARRFEALAAHSSDLVLVLDENLDISFASPSAQSVLGLDSSDVNIKSSLHDEDLGLLGHLVATASAGPGSVGPSEVRFLDSNNRSMWCEVVVTDLRNEPEVGGVVVNAHDVTGRK